MQMLIEVAPAAVDRLEQRLPAGFPERVYRTIRSGVRAQARRFKQSIAP
jgi:hypothetical protein